MTFLLSGQQTGMIGPFLPYDALLSGTGRLLDTGVEAGIRGADHPEAVLAAGGAAIGAVAGRRTDPVVGRGGPDRDGAGGEGCGEPQIDQLFAHGFSFSERGPGISPLLLRVPGRKRKAKGARGFASPVTTPPAAPAAWPRTRRGR